MYKLKYDLSMGGHAALSENVKYITDDVLRRIDEIAHGDIMRKHVEQAVQEEKDYRKKFPISSEMA